MWKLFLKKPFENDGSGVAVKILFRYGMVRYSFLQSAIFTAINQHRFVRERQSCISPLFFLLRYCLDMHGISPKVHLLCFSVLKIYWCYGLQSHYTDPDLP